MDFQANSFLAFRQKKKKGKDFYRNVDITAAPWASS